MNGTTLARDIMVGSDVVAAFSAAQHPASWERRVVALVQRLHPRLLDIARTANASAGGDATTLRGLHLALIDHVEESGLLLYREGASGWDDRRILDEAMRRAPRITDASLLAGLAEAAVWLSPIEQQCTQAVARTVGGLGRIARRVNAQIEGIAPSLRGHALMLAWTQAGRGNVPLNMWRATFHAVGYTHDGRAVPRPRSVPTLYRAANPASKTGWSWTDSLAFARYFQRMTGAGAVWVLEGVPAVAVLARYDSRGEAEWVIDMSKVDATPLPMIGEPEQPRMGVAVAPMSKGARKKAAQRARRMRVA
ncbi:hypothetical protein [Microbacterium dextranolyticum]|uniref:Uncharacterized protein n=2 Tax=Microbacterium dextranolyticum TaxID=36806 RepID=A0A9W6M6L0_9MICO|nr:hypothetical protein [Microbacterium dextranolyticum]MBM7463165.1 hypothetical protein [Microbacterium dextranolyticum]GLJ95730.1 hypothetical protein GCM10017591_17930 [Microbacterium dextranolyticum]